MLDEPYLARLGKPHLSKSSEEARMVFQDGSDPFPQGHSSATESEGSRIHVLLDVVPAILKDWRTCRSLWFVAFEPAEPCGRAFASNSGCLEGGQLKAALAFPYELHELLSRWSSAYGRKPQRREEVSREFLMNEEPGPVLF